MDKQAEVQQFIAQLRGKPYTAIQSALDEMRERGWLTDGSLQWANLMQIQLLNVDLSGAMLCGAVLFGCNLSYSNLANVDLRSADLRYASLTQSNLREADLSSASLSVADLTGADLSSSYLGGVDLSRATLVNTVFTGSICRFTVFAGTDLSTAEGLETIFHGGPSTVGVDTLALSQGKIPASFLRGCGVPDFLIKQQSRLVSVASEYPQSFISYSHKDEDFAAKLENALQNRGFRCWRDKTRMSADGTILDQVSRALDISGKMLLCASKNSLTNSFYVDEEIEMAFQKEQAASKASGKRQTVLIVLNIDGYIHSGEYTGDKKAWLRSRYCFDFTDWNNNAAFKRQIDRLTDSIRASNDPEPTPQDNS
ncbi:MAG TPA: toll/interleukin-1 receptor domain-containing protein [Aggregatilineales bacterium]|nr:toll/interleukin-1 receptor domain-containing protein [Aggregatilineales bacterium]